MKTLGEEHVSWSVDLSKYASEILSEEDHPLFDDAVRAGEVGAPRAAYVMIWLACAESLKHRCREAQLRDHTAGQIVSEIEKRESQHRAVDKFLLDKAHEYGFLSDSGNTILNHLYEMRCIYGHPYQEAPSREKVIDAAAAVVELVLSKPVKLRHGFGRQLLDDLLKNNNYLDDHEPAVAAMATNLLPRLDEGICVWLLDEYWKELEELSNDSSIGMYWRRGIWFCRSMLVNIGATKLMHEDWHDRFGRFPKILTAVCSDSHIFRHFGERAQDSLVGSALEKAKARPSVLADLEDLSREGALSKRQEERLAQEVIELTPSIIRASGLSTKTLYEKLIDAMTSYNWYVQNPAIDTIISNGPEQAAELSEDQQVELGRNILQCGEETTGSAVEFLEQLSHHTADWSFNVIRGIVLESFINEQKEIRVKIRQLHLVIAASVDSGTLKFRVRQELSDDAIALLNNHEWTTPLVNALERKSHT